jgi:glycerophosphoryl diester phosphodiesterase
LPSSRPLLLGHRGASRYAPENTIAAFELALRHNCDGFEFDVRYTRDAHAVVCHNPSSRRRRIEKHTLSEFTLPCVDEVIRNFVGRAYLDIELKVSGQVQPILTALRSADHNHFVISSFLPAVLEEVHAFASKIRLGLICENARQLKRWESLPICIVMTHRKLVTSVLVGEVHSAGKQIFAWTVNRQKEMLRLAELGVDGLISDDTLLLAGTLRSELGLSLNGI